MFSADTYAKRRGKLRRALGSGLILLPGNDGSPMNYADNQYHFRQDSSFLYFLGLNQAGLVGVLDCDTGEDWIFGDDLTVEDFVWTGPQPTLAERAKAVGLVKTAPLAAAAAMLESASKKRRKIHFLPPYRSENKIKLFQWLGVKPAEVAAKASIDLIKAVVDQRNYKSEEEIEEISRAVDTTVDMHTLGMRMAKPGVREITIAAALQQVAIAAGGQLSFPVIATIDGQTLHNHYHGNLLKAGDLFMLDAGAETAMGYAGDLSSTVPVSGKFTPRQREVYELCLDCHNGAIGMLKPGIPFKDVYFQTARMLVRGLQGLGLMKGNADDAVANGAHALFFPCGLGHMMGLDVHDMEDLGEEYVGYGGEAKSTQFGLKSLRLGRKLEPGFVLTIEPGIYFIPELIDQWKANRTNADYIDYGAVEAYRNFGGLRNEENFLITQDGCRRLGKPKPKSAADVEAEWAAAR